MEQASASAVPSRSARIWFCSAVVPFGGHCAFVEAPNGYDGYYAEKVVVDFLARCLPEAHLE